MSVENAVAKTASRETPNAQLPATSGPVRAEGALDWLPGDVYHVRSSCKRYSVCRLVVLGAPRFVAWKLNGTAPPTELGEVVLEAGATEEQRRDARRAMQAVCAAHAARPASGVAA
jgi:hypothetical protein